MLNWCGAGGVRPQLKALPSANSLAAIDAYSAAAQASPSSSAASGRARRA